MRKEDRLLEFVAGALGCLGAIVERSGARVEALVPGAVAARLQCDEHARLRIGAEPGEGEEAVTFGSDVLHRLLDTLRQSGAYTCYAIPDLYLKSGKLEAAVAAAFRFHGARVRFVEAQDVQLSYVIFSFHYLAASEDTREGLFHAAVNEHSLAAPPKFVETLASGLFHTDDAPPGDVLTPASRDAVFEKACALAREDAQSRIGDFCQALKRRKQRDIHRITDYYEELRKEANQRARRHGRGGIPREDLPQRLAAIDAEAQRKIRDLDDKYATRVTLSPVAVCRVFAPAVACRYTFQHRRDTFERDLFWNAVTKTIEPISCAGCKRDTYQPEVSDDLQFLCPACSA